MEHALTDGAAAVDDDRKSRCPSQPHLRRHAMQVADERVVGGGEVVQGRDVLARQDEQMERRRIDVADDDCVLVS